MTTGFCKRSTKIENETHARKSRDEFSAGYQHLLGVSNFDWFRTTRSALMKQAIAGIDPLDRPGNLARICREKECLTVDAELKRNAKSVIDKILHLRDSL
jgi:hypothetical protein